MPFEKVSENECPTFRMIHRRTGFSIIEMLKHAPETNLNIKIKKKRYLDKAKVVLAISKKINTIAVTRLILYIGRAPGI